VKVCRSLAIIVAATSRLNVLFPEVGNVVWKKVRRNELEETEARKLVIDLGQVAVETVGTRSLLEDALAPTLATAVTVYDAMYLMLAVRLETQVITGDDRFANNISDHRLLAKHVRRLQNFVD
jgi:predicted nucleic acid-binding protein